MSEEYESILKSITELKVKIPSLLDIVDEVLAHETRFKSIDEKTQLFIEQLQDFKKQLKSLELNNSKLKELAEDDNNVTVAIVFLEELLKRKDPEIKKYLKESFCVEDNGKFIADALLNKKKEIADFVWKSLEEKLQLYIGKRVVAGGVSIGVILGIIFLIISLVQKYAI